MLRGIAGGWLPGLCPWVSRGLGVRGIGRLELVRGAPVWDVPPSAPVPRALQRGPESMAPAAPCMQLRFGAPGRLDQGEKPGRFSRAFANTALILTRTEATAFIVLLSTQHLRGSSSREATSLRPSRHLPSEKRAGEVQPEIPNRGAAVSAYADRRERSALRSRAAQQPKETPLFGSRKSPVGAA